MSHLFHRIDKAVLATGENSFLMLLIGNKMDLTEEDRQVSTEEAERLASHLNIQYFESSAKENVNVTEVIEHLLNNIPEEAAEVAHPPDSSLLVGDLNSESGNKKNNCC